MGLERGAPTAGGGRRRRRACAVPPRSAATVPRSRPVRALVTATALVTGLATALVASGCVAAPSRPLPARPASAPCTVASIRSCALPYPSDEFTVADPTTATGRRVTMPADLVADGLVRQLGPGASPEEVVAGADGFSAVGPVVFEFDRAVDLPSLEADDFAAVAVYDVADGQRVPVRADLPVESLRQGAPGSVVMVWPRTRWEPGHTYVARIDDRLRSGAYGQLRPTLATIAARHPYLAGIRADLRRFEGDRWGRVLTATRFTVRSAANATATLDRMAAVARADDHPVRNLAVDRTTVVEGAAAVVRGEVRLTDFRDAQGVVRPDRAARTTWERFLLVVPARPARAAGAPVVVYGHGITVAKETMLIAAEQNAAAGMATIGVDAPNHGDRQDEGGYVLDLTTPAQLGLLAAMILQAEVDTVSLVRAVQVHLRGRDLVGGDGRAELDTGSLFYVGTSMGGVLGASAVALVPEFRGAFLQVAGSGIADILYHSQIWPFFSGVVPTGGPPGDAMALMGAATMLLDPGDSTNLLDRVRARGTPVLLLYGVGDAIVPNRATDRMAALLGLPRLDPVARPAGPSTAAGALVPADGRGAVPVPTPGLTAVDPGFAGHLVFSTDLGVRVLEDWLAGRAAALGPAR